MAEARADDALDVVRGHLIASLVRHERLRRAGHDDIAAESVDVHERAHAGDLERQVPVHRDVGEDLLRRGNLSLELVRLSLTRRGERLRVRLVRHAVLHQLDPLLLVEDGGDVARRAEAVQKLGAELALLGVARSNHDKLSRVGDGDTLALDGVPPARGGVQHHVHERVVQEVHLVDVEQAAVGASQEAGVVRLDALRESLLDVDGTADPVLGGAEGNLHHGNLHLSRGEGAAGLELLQRLGAHELGIGRGRVEGVALDDVDLGEEIGEGANGDGLAGAAVAHDEAATDAGILRSGHGGGGGCTYVRSELRSVRDPFLFSFLVG